MRPILGIVACLAAVVVPAGTAWADSETVVVSATRQAQEAADLPVSIDRLDRQQIQDGQLGVNLSETLDQVPGVVAQNRQNYAQDLQLSVRGFGARSSFGVRGVRLYADGIPGTMPDGQGQFSHFDLGSAGRIEILRGPFSVLYGNSSGGVISIFTEDGPPGGAVDAVATAGSLGLQRYGLAASGQRGAVNYVADASHFQIDGYRDHSAAERSDFNSKVRIELDARSSVTFVGNAIETPFVQDPLGLTRPQWMADPSQAGTNALAYNTRKSLGQEQLGVIYTQALEGDGEIVATAFGGHRRTVQFQAILATAEARPSHPGGVIDLEREFWGADLHAARRFQVAGGLLTATAGLSYDALDEARRGFLNFVATDLGVEGALRRNEANRVHDLDEYLELQWQPSDRWRLIGGARHSLIDVGSTNRLAAAGAPALSGVSYQATDPVAGLLFKVNAALNAYLSYGKGFETPTLNDIAYRSIDGSVPGLNLGLKPARSDNFEVGLKARGTWLSANLAAFYISTRDELAVQTNSGGRSVFQNIDGTHRTGAELAADAEWNAQWSSHVGFTYLRAVTSAPYTTCVGIPCLPVLIPAGNRLPAVPATSSYASLTWRRRPESFAIGAELVNRAQIYFDDRNSDAAAGYWAANAYATLAQRFDHWRLSESLRVENIGDRRYAGTVIVNESNSRFLESAPGRTVYFSVKAAFGR